MALIAAADIKVELGIAADNTDNDTIFAAMIAGVESIWAEMTRRTWEATNFTERISGGGSVLCVSNPPINSITRIGFGRRQLAVIYNTADESTANVKIASTGLVLTLDGVTDSTVLFATYKTITTVVAAVNALESGWYAAVENSYGDWKSSELLTMFPQSCIDSNPVYLSVPHTYLDDYEVVENEGRIYRPGGFPEGFKNLYVDYNGGYTDGTDVPGWLTKVLVRQCCHWYRQAKDQRWDMSSKSEPAGGGTVAFTKLQDNLLPDFVMVAKMHRRPM